MKPSHVHLEAPNLGVEPFDTKHRVEEAIRQVDAHLQAQRLDDEQRKAVQAVGPQVAVLESGLLAAVQAP